VSLHASEGVGIAGQVLALEVSRLVLEVFQAGGGGEGTGHDNLLSLRPESAITGRKKVT
jgi:hypothetical protein